MLPDCSYTPEHHIILTELKMSTHGDPHLEMGTYRAHHFPPDRGTENAFTERETRNPSTFKTIPFRDPR